MRIYKMISKYMKLYRLQLIFYMIISLCLSCLGLMIPYLSGTFIDDLIQDASVKVIYKFTFLIIFISFFQLCFSYISTILSTKLKYKLSYLFNKDLINHLQSTSLLFLEKTNAAYLSQRVNSDCFNLINFSFAFLNGVIINTITLVVCFIVILRINTVMCFIIFLLVFSYLVLYKILNQPLSKSLYQSKEITSEFLSSLQEQFQDARLIKIFNLFRLFSNRLDSDFEKYFSANFRLTKLNFIFRSSDILIKMVSQVLLFSIGGYQILKGHLTIGLFTVLSSYFINLINSTKFFINLFNQYIDNNVSAKRLSELMNIPSERCGVHKIKELKYIKIDNLSFKYKDDAIIDEFSFIFSKGKVYKISGENGKGKSTLVSLMIGLYPYDYKGEIFYNNMELKNIDMRHLRTEVISYIGQESLFFTGSIKENLKNDNPSITDEELSKLLNILPLESYEHTSLDSILNMEINAKKNNLSGGELKKLSIIRGLAKASSLLILDEPANSLDQKSKETLKKYLEQIKKEKVIILISHDTIFDEIIDIEIKI